MGYSISEHLAIMTVILKPARKITFSPFSDHQNEQKAINLYPQSFDEFAYCVSIKYFSHTLTLFRSSSRQTDLEI